MRILVACEFSGVVRNAFLAKGHDAYSCDILSGREPTHGRHVRGDVRKLLGQHWDLVIAHPPCTYLCNSGVRWLAGDEERQENLQRGCTFFLACLGANAPKVAVENPIPHKYALRLIGSTYSQIIQPWWFGHAESKATCLWLKGLPPLEAVQVVKPVHQRVARMPPIAIKGLRSHLRSVTFTGIASAMAEQWG